MNVDVIQISVDCLDDDVGSVLFQLFEPADQKHPYTLIQDFTSILSRPHKMVVTVENRMIHSSILHA